ncbi:DUF1972 domain-containing protein [Guptibacillus hwajinpoensis]|uniref:Glycosyltransferase involved in cell wall biosynthesis n=1 Tax=Guptibacillus hwajinpoensis TaxID=208199 RepID=A0ABU0JZ91_9BACL|nr:DUF1972 domain-containing protein [Alkalihalobacillus hemicentroti]MDQ0482432.1 glycosyltransferase involved in cell wall biosynthesis [Alkalihalobacillus hemicentroti]
MLKQRTDNKNQELIAFCGTRGIPANYGGFETAVDEITKHFVNKGYDCQVFCRKSSSPNENDLIEHKKRRLAYVSGSKYRKLDTFISSIQTALHIIRNKNDYKYIFWFNNANFLGIVLTLLFTRIPVSINTDGLEWKREKWSLPFKLYYFISSFILTLLSSSLISDSLGIQKYYKNVFRKETIFIPYGAPNSNENEQNYESEILNEFDLVKGKYFLQVTRFEPDNLPLLVLENFSKSNLWKKGYKMVLVGYKEPTNYALKIKGMSGSSGIQVLDAIYDSTILSTLRKNCCSYVHGNSVGGTNPALLEAMSTCPRIMAIDLTFSREVLGNNGLLFNHNNMDSIFEKTISLPNQNISMKKRVDKNYRWDKVSESYINLVEGKAAGYSIEANEEFKDILLKTKIK